MVCVIFVISQIFTFAVSCENGTPQKFPIFVGSENFLYLEQLIIAQNIFSLNITNEVHA